MDSKKIINECEKNNINCKIWHNVDNANFIYPENNFFQFYGKSNIGIAFTGGGLRSCCLAIGFLRGFHYINIIKDIKYISSNSGSSWLLGIMSYMNQDINLGDFLGEYISPGNLTIQKLKETNDKCVTSVFHDAKQKNNIIKNNKIKINKYDMYNSWCETISEHILKKYGLDDINMLPTIQNHDKESIIPYVYKSLRKDLPFPIINGSIFIEDSVDISPIEFTPLYYGIPKKIIINENKIIGSYYIEPIGFTSVNDNKEAIKLTEFINNKKNNQQINNKKNNQQINNKKNYKDKMQKNDKMTNNSIDINILKPNHVISISKQISISSSSLPTEIKKKINNYINSETELPFLNYYDPSGYFNDDVKLCDGGFVDNSGFFALLRRNVAKIIFCGISMFNSTSISSNINDSNIAYNFASLFGVATKNNKKCIDINKKNKVFCDKSWDDLILNAKIKYDEKLPMIIYMKLNVEKNEFAGINGNYVASVIFILNYKNNWMDKIPKIINKYINDYKLNICDKLLSCIKIKSTKFEKFPYVSNDVINYDIELVNAMAHISSYDIIENEKDIKNFLML